MILSKFKRIFLFLIFNGLSFSYAAVEDLASDLEKDISSFEVNLEPYLKVCYSNQLDQYNLKRLYDFVALYRKLIIQRDNDISLVNLETKNFVELAAKNKDGGPLVFEYAGLAERLKHFNQTMEKLNNEIQVHLNEAELLRKIWNERVDSDVVLRVSELMDFKTIFPQPIIRPTTSRDGYSIVFDIFYNPGANKVTFARSRIESTFNPFVSIVQVIRGIPSNVFIYTGNENGGLTKEEFAKDLIATFLERVFSSSKDISQDVKIDNLAAKLNEVVLSKREAVASEQSKYVKSSILKVMSDKLGKSFVFSLRLEELISDFQSIKNHIELKRSEVDRKLSGLGIQYDSHLNKLIRANTKEIVERNMKRRDLDTKQVKSFHSKASDFIFKNTDSIEKRISQVSGDIEKDLSQKYSAVVDLIREDALLSADYLIGESYRDEKDIFFNLNADDEGYYPVGPWSVYLDSFYKLIRNSK